MNKNNQSGYILLLTLLISSITIMIVIQIFKQATVQHFFDKISIQREQAKKLAYSGIELAFSSLNIVQKKTNDIEKTEKSKPPIKQSNAETSEENSSAVKKTPSVEFIKKIVPVLNIMQIFALQEDIDDIEGTISFCITSEEGKLNINKIFDFAKKDFVGGAEAKKRIQAFFAAIKSITNKELFEPFEKYLKQRLEPLHDVTELLSIKEFQEYFKGNIFYDPQKVGTAKGDKIVFLTDLFTISSTSNTINPWLFSYSVATLIGATTMSKGNPQERKKELTELLKELSQLGSLQSMWEKYLAKIYGKEFKALPKDLTPLLATGLSFKNFTILSYGTIGEITQKLAAIIERSDDTKFLIKKIYWI